MASDGSFDQPSANDFIVGATPTNAFMQWVSRVHVIATANRQSGVTADRPTSILWIGRRYFDTTLGKPVFLKSIRPNVWVDGVGTVS